MSGSNSAAESSETSKELECEICNVPFDTKIHCPRILKQCGHTICEECAGKLWEQGKKRSVMCPFDRKCTKVKDDIKNLPKNYTLERLLETMKAEGVSVPPIPIGRCSRDPSHEAWFTCEECEADFCESCFDTKHSLSEQLMEHKKIPSIDKSYEAKKCKKHPENFADFVCQDWDCDIVCKAICNVCLLNEHKDHEYGPIVDVVALNQRKLKEELIKRPISEETMSYLENDISGKVLAYDEEANLDEAEVVERISCIYDNLKDEAIKKWRDFAEQKFVAGHEAMEEYEEVEQKETALDNIRNEMRRRLGSKRKLENVEKIVARHRKTREELNRKRDAPLKITWPNEMILKFPLTGMEIIDPNEPSTSTPSTSSTSANT